MDPIRKFAHSIQRDMNGHFHPAPRKITPDEIELIIFVITTLMTVLRGCWGEADGPVVERLAYRWVTHRPWFSWRTETIRDRAASEWTYAGGDPSMAYAIGYKIERTTRDLTWEDFHAAWVKLHGE